MSVDTLKTPPVDAVTRDRATCGRHSIITVWQRFQKLFGLEKYVFGLGNFRGGLSFARDEATLQNCNDEIRFSGNFARHPVKIDRSRPPRAHLRPSSCSGVSGSSCAISRAILSSIGCLPVPRCAASQRHSHPCAWRFTSTVTTSPASPG